MKIAIQGSNTFSDYSIFLAGIGRCLYSLPEGDNEFLIYSAGPSRLNSMGIEFKNISERSLKARGVKIKFYKVPPSWIKENIYGIDYFAYFCNTKESVSKLVDYAESKDIEVGIYRF